MQNGGAMKDLKAETGAMMNIRATIGLDLTVHLVSN
jgi:hypothetical protein